MLTMDVCVSVFVSPILSTEPVDDFDETWSRYYATEGNPNTIHFNFLNHK
jgi:hypothetical protein